MERKDHVLLIYKILACVTGKGLKNKEIIGILGEAIAMFGYLAVKKNE